MTIKQKLAFGFMAAGRLLGERIASVGSVVTPRRLFAARFDHLEMTGPEKYSGLPLRVRYLGEGKSLEYLQREFFREVPHAVPVRSYSLVDLARGAFRAVPVDHDICVREYTPRVARLLREEAAFQVPDWVEQEILLDGTWDDTVSRFRKNTRSTDLRKVRKYNFGHDVTTDRETIGYFYDNLYVPHISKRFQEAAEIIDREWLIAVAQDSGLLRILNQGQFIAGAVLHYARDYLDWIWVGAAKQADSELDKGTFSALYFHSIRHAHDKGFKRMKIGNTRPLLSDGVYRYKRKWGARVTHGRYSSTQWLVDFDYRVAAVRRWLESSPFLTLDGDRFHANVFTFDEGAGTALAKAEEIASPGIDTVRIHSPETLPELPARIDACELCQARIRFDAQFA